MKKYIIILLLCLAKTGTFAQTITSLGSGLSGFSKTPFVLFTDTIDNVMYAGGGFKTAGGVNCYGIAKWNGQYWDSLGSGLYFNATSFINTVVDIVRFQNDIYIGGNLKIVGGKPIYGLAKWNGNEWLEVGGNVKNDTTGPTSNINGVVRTMKVFNNELYIGGLFDSVGTIASKNVAKWNGSTWTALGKSFNIDCGNDGVSSLEVFNGEIYASGNFNCPLPGNERISKLVDTNWVQVGNSINGDAIIDKLYAYNSSLYVGGYFFANNGNADNSLMFTDGFNYYPTSGGVLPSNLLNMINYQNELYVVGQIDYAGFNPINRIGKWDGSQWVSINLALEHNLNVVGTAGSLAIYDGKLVIGGSFTSINGVPATNIAMVDFTVGLPTKQNDKNLTIFPNPTSNLMNIQLEKGVQEGSVKLYNQFGQVVYSQTKGVFKSINVSTFAKGVYFAEVRQEDKVMRQKVVVE